jgi:hypothetical protein
MSNVLKNINKNLKSEHTQNDNVPEVTLETFFQMSYEDLFGDKPST